MKPTIFVCTLSKDAREALEADLRSSDVSVLRRYLCFPQRARGSTPIEAIWDHPKREMVEPDGLLAAHELAERVCEVFGCVHEPHLSISQEVA